MKFIDFEPVSMSDIPHGLNVVNVCQGGTYMVPKLRVNLARLEFSFEPQYDRR